MKVIPIYTPTNICMEWSVLKVLFIIISKIINVQKCRENSIINISVT